MYHSIRPVNEPMVRQPPVSGIEKCKQEQNIKTATHQAMQFCQNVPN